MQHLNNWFYRPITFKPEELQSVKTPVLLILGEKDNLVRNPVKVSQYAQNVPDIQIEVLDTGHLIGVEQSDRVNQLVLEFFER
jgi:pimeloyl-ACP methyl ester carboxylesterase